MIDQTVARRYARALLDVALDQSTADAIKGELSEIRKQIEGEGGFKSIIAAGVTMAELAAEQQVVTVIGHQLEEMTAIIEGHKDLRKILFQGLFAMQQRKDILTSLCKQAGTLPQVRNFVLLLVDKDRLRYLPVMAQLYREAADELAGRKRGHVVSASALSSSEQEQVEEKLGKIVGRKVQCSFDVDAEVLGGVRAEVGSLVVDGTVRAQLDRLTQTLGQG